MIRKIRSITLKGNLTPAGSGRVKVGDVELRPVYHLLDPAFDNLKGSWRQMLFPKENPH
jgi:hypothetical protein